MYQKIIKPTLFAMSIEQAHRVVLIMLRVIGKIPGGRWFLKRCYMVEHPTLRREVLGYDFPNPIGIAAGFDCNGDVYRELSSLGFGFVEIGTITPNVEEGNPQPRVYRLTKDSAIVNRMGCNNRGLNSVIAQLRKPRKGVIIGCCIGKNMATSIENAHVDYLKSFRNLYQYTDYFTIDINCDNATRESSLYSKSELLSILNPLFEFRRGQEQFRPIMLKLSPDLSPESLTEVIDILISTPLDGVVATTGSRRRERLKTSFTAIDNIGTGRISGTPLTERSIEIVREIHTRTNGQYPIIGVGGIMSASDAKNMLAAGASLIQLYTGYIYQGPGLVRQICEELIADSRRQTEEVENHDQINDLSGKRD